MGINKINKYAEKAPMTEYRKYRKYFKYVDGNEINKYGLAGNFENIENTCSCLAKNPPLRSLFDHFRASELRGGCYICAQEPPPLFFETGFLESGRICLSEDTKRRFLHWFLTSEARFGPILADRASKNKGGGLLDFVDPRIWSSEVRVFFC